MKNHEIIFSLTFFLQKDMFAWVHQLIYYWQVSIYLLQMGKHFPKVVKYVLENAEKRE